MQQDEIDAFSETLGAALAIYGCVRVHATYWTSKRRLSVELLFQNQAKVFTLDVFHLDWDGNLTCTGHRTKLKRQVAVQHPVLSGHELFSHEHISEPWVRVLFQYVDEFHEKNKDRIFTSGTVFKSNYPFQNPTSKPLDF